MARKITNFSDLVQRVTASCLLHPLAGVQKDEYDESAEEDEEEEDVDLEDEFEMINPNSESHAPPRVMELEMLLSQVFDAVSSMKRAYVSLQEAHCPWDPDKMRISDVAVVAELRRLGLLGERFRRSVGGGGRIRGMGAATVRQVVAPYEAAVEELKREVKARQTEVDNLTEKLKTASFSDRSSGKSKGKSRRRVSCTTQVAAAPAVELFEATMSSVNEASKSFTSLLLSLMRSAHWDISAAVRSIEAASSTTTFTDSIVGPTHAKYALESYLNRKIFQGFDHETFYMDGTLTSILHPDQHRKDCFTQYRDMKAMDPVELLGILPTCSFGKFCFKKYLSIVHPKMEESLFGDLEQRRRVLDGYHPRSQFYGEFLRLAKAVWLLHLLAFSLDPSPSHFEASVGAEFHEQYMENAVRISGGNGGSKMGIGSMIVGFPVSPGFKVGNGSIIKARVYLVPKNR
ncbi:Protein GRAVITROPIC IN THE LIGHT 1 [Castilleja foliolosa]|uniref:Protein GRAVITROPIC IN THE LIGHT 1 n=1 Tax=Castilleja foliolosa TaxID=1961234 RepID=A0ABD3C5A3_9LAMI